MDLGDMAGFRLAIQSQYDGHYGARSSEESRARARDLAPYLAGVLAALDLPDEGWHLDLGCGDGLAALAVARARPRMRVLGVDASPRALDLARRVAREDALANVAFVEADAEAPPEGAFERLSALSVFNLMPDKVAALAAWRAVAAPDARLVLADGFDARGPGTLGVGAATHAGLAHAARVAGWRIARREDLTPLVRRLHEAKRWAWPEYVREGVRFGMVVLRAS